VGLQWKSKVNNTIHAFAKLREKQEIVEIFSTDLKIAGQLYVKM